jgi:hypothetical protein
MRKFYSGLVAGLNDGLSTWDIQFSLLFLLKGWLSVVPRERLVINAGVADERATHTGGYVYWAKEWVKAGKLDSLLIHPEKVICDKDADYVRERMEGAIFPRGLTWLGAKFPCLSKALTCIGEIAEKVAPALFRL